MRLTLPHPGLYFLHSHAHQPTEESQTESALSLSLSLSGHSHRHRVPRVSPSGVRREREGERQYSVASPTTTNLPPLSTVPSFHILPSTLHLPLCSSPCRNDVVSGPRGSEEGTMRTPPCSTLSLPHSIPSFSYSLSLLSQFQLVQVIVHTEQLVQGWREREREREGRGQYSPTHSHSLSLSLSHSLCFLRRQRRGGRERRRE